MNGNGNWGLSADVQFPIPYHQFPFLSSCFGDALLEEVVERNGVVADEVSDLVVERGEDGFVRGDERRFVAVASCKVLRGDDTHHFTAVRLNE